MVAAERREFAGLLRGRRAERVDLRVDYAARVDLATGAVLLVANGPGPKLAREACQAALQSGVRALVSTGFCGALDPALEPGAVVVGDTVGDGATDLPAVLPRKLAAAVRILSLDRVVDRVSERALWFQQGFAVIEMEALAVAREASQAGVALHVVKAVSDGAGHEFVVDLNTMRRADGRFDTGRIVRSAVLSGNKGIADLLRLARRSSLAASRLGEFLADCQF